MYMLIAIVWLRNQFSMEVVMGVDDAFVRILAAPECYNNWRYVYMEMWKLTQNAKYFVLSLLMILATISFLLPTSETDVYEEVKQRNVTDYIDKGNK